MKTPSDIYSTYCNDFQNASLGAYIIVKFAENFYKSSNTDRKVNIIHIFVIIPMILNSNYRNCIGKKRIIHSLIKSINENKLTFGSYQDMIDKYKEYSMCSLIFALRLGLVQLDRDNILLKTNKLPNYYSNLIGASEQLGKLFANADLFSFLSFVGVHL